MRAAPGTHDLFSFFLTDDWRDSVQTGVQARPRRHVGLYLQSFVEVSPPRLRSERGGSGPGVLVAAGTGGRGRRAAIFGRFPATEGIPCCFFRHHNNSFYKTTTTEKGKRYSKSGPRPSGRRTRVPVLLGCVFAAAPPGPPAPPGSRLRVGEPLGQNVSREVHTSSV